MTRIRGKRPNRTKTAAALLLAGALPLAMLATPTRDAEAFCGFYVSGADAKLFNNATQVVLMREGTRTVLSMQNNYQGPPEDFAMVVPVPVVLSEENVRILPANLFDRVDRLAAPRLVEYWEQDPCYEPPVEEAEMDDGVAESAPSPDAGGLGVTVEAEFAVGEYDVVILSADDSSGLDTWLKNNKYKIPEGAAPVLEPYVQDGMKFFVAKVDPKKVAFKDGMATLSPLRFHYDSDEFRLPVRLGLLNAKDKQDLIVHILSRTTRYEVANYPNVTIPTNLDVAEAARDDFGPFYAALFDKTLEENPKAVVTEYAWDAATCDPCPSPPLTPADLATLGADSLTPRRGTDEEADDEPPNYVGRVTLGQVDAPLPVLQNLNRMLPGFKGCFEKARADAPDLSGEATLKLTVGMKGEPIPTSHTGGEGLPSRMLSCVKSRLDLGRFPAPTAGAVEFSIPIRFESIVAPPPVRVDGSFTLTRLHARYDKSVLGEDLVFKEAEPIAGGREIRDGEGKLETGSKPAGRNNFQGRYAIRHPWTGEITCDKPRRGEWGPPPRSEDRLAGTPRPATNTAFAKRGGITLASMLRDDVPELGIKGQAPPPSADKPDAGASSPDDTVTTPPKDGACDACSVGAPTSRGAWPIAGLLALAASLIGRRRRR